MKNYKVIYYPESKFGGFADIDSTIAFYIRVNSFINSSSIVLDVGCGRGSHAEDPVSLKRDLLIFLKSQFSHLEEKNDPVFTHYYLKIIIMSNHK